MDLEAEYREQAARNARMAEQARQGYAAGKSMHEVVTAAYGVDLPEEDYVFHQSGLQYPELLADRVFLPWELMELANPQHAKDEADPWSVEQMAHARLQAPSFLPLMKLSANDCLHDGYVLGYSVELLRQGKRTLLGHAEDIPPTGATFEVVGDSLLSVLHAWMSDHVRLVRKQYDAPSNRGFGSISYDDVEVAEARLKAIAALQQVELAE